MVASEGDQTRESAAGKGVAFLVGGGGRGAGEERMVARLNLREGVGVVVGGDGDVAAVQDGGPAVEGVGVEGDVVAAAEPEFACQWMGCQELNGERVRTN